jgi:hypothetical protein
MQTGETQIIHSGKLYNALGVDFVKLSFGMDEKMAENCPYCWSIIDSSWSEPN